MNRIALALLMAMAILATASFAEAGVIIGEGINFTTGEKRIAYEVKRGDTICHIGRKVISKKVTLAEVLEKIAVPNGIKNPRKLKIGTILIIQVPLSEADYLFLALQKAAEENFALEKEVIESRIALREAGNLIFDFRDTLVEAGNSLAATEDKLSGSEAEKSNFQSQNERLKTALYELGWFCIILIVVTFISILASILIYIRYRAKEDSPEKNLFDFGQPSEEDRRKIKEIKETIDKEASSDIGIDSSEFGSLIDMIEKRRSMS